MNKVNLIGRLCNDLELKTTGENKYIRFTLAINRRFKNAQGEYDADFISCVAWNKTAETINEHFHKGNQIGIVGRIQSGSYEKEDGTKNYTTDIIVEEFDFIDKKNNERPAPEYAAAPTEVHNENIYDEPDTIVISDNDLPF